MITGYSNELAPVDRILVWSAQQWPGIEHNSLRVNGQGVTADGELIAVVDEQPVRLHYWLECDSSWRPVGVTVEVHGRPSVSLRRSGSRWYDGAGQDRPDLEGCLDVDIALTPFTNTIPIRRLALDVGDSAELDVVYIHPIITVDITAQHQTYTRTATGYRYASGTFRADLLVDSDGIVLDYPGLWTLTSG